MEWIKSILEKHVGEDGKLNLDEAIKEINKDAPKNVIPKDQYNTVSTAKTQLEADLKERDTQLDTLKKSTGNVEELQAQITKLQGDNAKAKADYDEKVKNMKYDSAIEKALSSALHPELIGTKIDRAKLKLDKDENVLGLDEQVTGLKETYKDQFKPNKTGPSPANNGQPTGTVTQDQFNKMGYNERAQLFSENKELYDQLIGGNE